MAATLRCRSAAILVIGADGEVVVEGSVNWSPGLTRQVRAAASNLRRHASALRPLTGNRQGDASISLVSQDVTALTVALPFTLADGTHGLIAVAGREDGTEFDPQDVAMVEHLSKFYVSLMEVPAEWEALRLSSELQALRAQAIRGEERERQRLARELHDDVGHALTTAILGIDMQAQCLAADTAERQALSAARTALTECADHLHEFAFRLRPRVLNDLGLTPALRGLARRVRETGRLDVTVTSHGKERRLDVDTELAAFRIVQEALTNALKHAHASRLSVVVIFAERWLEVEISDDGVGFVPSKKERSRGPYGQGLSGMRERAELVGGVIEFKSRPGLGTTVWARLPVLEG